MKFANALLAVAGLALPLALAADPLLQVTAVTGPTGAKACTDSLMFSASVIDLSVTPPTGNFQFLDNSTPKKILCQAPLGTGGAVPKGLLSTDALSTLLASVLNNPASLATTALQTLAGTLATAAAALPAVPLNNPIVAPVPINVATPLPVSTALPISIGRRLLAGTVDVGAANALLTSAVSLVNGVPTSIGANGADVLSLLNPLLANAYYTVTCTTPGGTLAPGTYSYGGVGLPSVAGTGTILAALAPALGATPAVVLPASFTIGPCPTPAPTPASTTGCPTGITITSSIPEITIPACLAPTFTVTLTGLPAAATTLPTVSINGFGGNLLKQILSPTDAGFSIAKGLTVTASAGSATVTATMPATSLKHGTYSAVATVDGCPDLTAKVPFEQTIACLTKVNGRRLAM